VYAGRSFDHLPSTGPAFRHGRSIAMNNDHGNWNGDWNHHHFDRHHHRFNNVFIYRGDYGSYAYNDCYWLRRQAQITEALIGGAGTKRALGMRIESAQTRSRSDA
jgi:hypothetical protein